MARRTIRRSRRSTGRRLVWARDFATQQFVAGQAAVFDDLLSDFQTVLGADANGVTVTRIRGEIVMQWTQPNGTTPTLQRTTAGIRVGDVAASGTDADQLTYLPANRPYSDWMWARNATIVGTAADATADARVTSILRISLDIKAQRRIDELQQSLFLFYGSPSDIAVNHSLTVQTDFHILLRKP